jgi:hypothetical protein
MQHLDEGTIHGWLDGALSADETARVEAHVKHCPQCDARVAEARGLIAASSRILTALDNVPSRVLPRAAHVKRRNWPVWRAAAAVVVVVAVGTLVGTPSSIPVANQASIRDSSTESVERSLPAVTQTQSAAPASPSRVKVGQEGKQSVVPKTRRTSVPAPESAPEDRATVGAVAGTPHSELANAAEPRVITGAAASVGERAASPQPGPIALVGAATNAPLRIVGSPRVIGEKRTLYEVVPGDTVLLVESEGLALNSVVTGTGTEADPQVQRTMSAPASVPKRDAPSPSAFAGSSGINTISWSDVASGKAMKLSGHHSRAELETIRRRIEQLRQVDSVRRKTP